MLIYNSDNNQKIASSQIKSNFVKVASSTLSRPHVMKKSKSLRKENRKYLKDLGFKIQ